MSSRFLDFSEKILFLLYYSENRTTLITRAMKLMFLFEELFDLKGEESLDYISYELGPFAENFQISISPLITEQIISYKEVFDRKSTYIPINCKRLYLINPEREKEIEKVLKENYLNTSNFKKEIELIKILSEFYDHKNLTDLIQLCYLLKPNFSQNSIIKEEIEAHDKSYNQEIIIKLIKKLDEEYIIKLLNNTDGILKLFSINDENIEGEHFNLILENFHHSFSVKSQIDKESLIHVIDNIAINDSKEVYKFLKYKLLETFTFEKTNFRDIKSKRNFLIFFLRALQLKYPLNRKSLVQFRHYFNELKDSIDFRNYKDELPPLELNYQEFKKELRNKIKDKEQPDTKKEKPLYREKIISSISTEKLRTKKPTFYLIEEIDEFSEKDKEESIKITGEDEKIFVDFEEKIESKEIN